MKEQQFTFYKVYWDAIKNEDNETIDAIVTGICEYMLFDNNVSTKLDHISVWDDLFTVLKDEHARQLKNPSGITRRRGLAYFTFKLGYYNKMKCLSREESGAYVRAICEYMFYGKEPHDLPPRAECYYRATKLQLDLSSKRTKGGNANGKSNQKPAAKPKVTTEQSKPVETEQVILSIIIQNK